jgi:hypothetical protein
MIFLLVLLIIGAVSLVVYALIRGLHAFVDPERAKNEDHSTFAVQNKMMFARVKWQAIVVILIVIIGYVAAQ